MDYVKPNLSTSEIEDLVFYSKDLAISSGIIVKYDKENYSNEAVINAPLMLFPSPVPRNCFENAKSIQIHFNILFHKVAHDYNFLKKCFQHTVEVDDYTKRLWGIYESVYSANTESISFNINRSDYMFHSEKDNICIKQVEFNTMASSFAGLSSLITQFHRTILDVINMNYSHGRLPNNDTLGGIVQGFITAWELYDNKNAAIVFLVDQNEWNKYDQRMLEFGIKKKNSAIKVMRLTLDYLNTHAKLGPDNELFVGKDEIAIVYFRYTYHPSHFKCEKDWETRLLIERSTAIKCPSIQYFLAGMKKVQQMLTNDDILEKYVPNEKIRKCMQDTFVGLYSLDLGEKGDINIKNAISNPHKYVIKPQREGGGNNIYGDEVKDFLEKNFNSKERNAYILMDRINAVPIKSIRLQCDFNSPYEKCISELGVYGVIIGSQSEIFMNSQSGHLLGTKIIESDEGGVCAGYSSLDSMYLID